MTAGPIRKILGTTKPSTELSSDEFCCRRCGIILTFSRKKPEMCRDCIEVETGQTTLSNGARLLSFNEQELLRIDAHSMTYSQLARKYGITRRMASRYAEGVKPPHVAHRLTASQRKQLRKDASTGMNWTDIGRRYGIHRTTAMRIVEGRSDR